MREPIAARWQVGRPAILLGLAFLLGTGIGWVVTRPFAGQSSQSVANADYVAVVAQLFQRDHNEEVARERLALLGSPPALVEQAVQDAQSGKVKSQADRTAVEALAQVLAPSSVAATPSGDVAAVGQARQAAATPITSDHAPAPSGQSSWVGPVVAFILAFALGAVVLLRTAGLSLPSVGVLGGLAGGLAKPRLPERPTRPRPAVATLQTGDVPVRRVRNLGSVPRGGPAIEDDGDEPVAEPLPARPGSRTATLLKPRVSTAPPARRLSFESCYRLGDEPYDEIHPITDPSTGALVAACGLSSALKHDGPAASRYYAFTAWVQDYVSGEQLRAVGLVTPRALERERGRIDEWVREGQVDEVLPVRDGGTTELAADTITTSITVTDVDHDGGASSDYFTRLTVRFEVRWDG